MHIGLEPPVVRTKPSVKKTLPGTQLDNIPSFLCSFGAVTRFSK